MTQTASPPLADEITRLQECAQEPIHRPGAIQPHGALLVVDPHTHLIAQASLNTARILGVPARELLQTRLGELIIGASWARLRAAVATGEDGETNPVAVVIAGTHFDVIVHRVDGLCLVEFEPTGAKVPAYYLPALHAALKRLSKLADVQQLRTQAAREIRRLTGYEQVMVYQFHPDGHGEIMADDHAAGMTTYLGLHFPASDIPAQARRLYLLKGSGLIASSTYEPAALEPVDNPRTGVPVDLSLAELRSVSPYHLQFMRNMGQGSSLTLSLIGDGRLQGMITCAHRDPYRIPFLLRRTCEIVAQQVSLQLGAITRASTLTRQLQARDVRNLLVDRAKADSDLATGLIGSDVSLLDLVEADGVSVCLHHKITSVGRTPSDAQVTAMLTALRGGATGVPPMFSEALALDRPELARHVPSVAGVLVLPFGGPGDCLLWFRREIAQTVDWLGEQSPTNRTGVLAPRTSFESWRQTVTGRSAAWDEAQIAEAAELGRDLDQLLLHWAETQLAYMGLHDALTGLPNRNFLVDHITAAITQAERDGAEVVLLFCDLDDFKRVNDTAGHAAGDAVLIEVAARLSAVLRAGDLIARVGGDEFVIVLQPARSAGPPGTVIGAVGRAASRQEAAEISGRIKSELSRPFSYDGQEYTISVSVGMTFAVAGSRAETLLSDADAALYRAKRGGKNQVQIFDESLRASIADRARAGEALQSALTPGGVESAVVGPARLGLTFAPVLDVDSGRLVGFAALAGLTDVDGRSVDADLFLPVAEQSGLVYALGAAVVDGALAGLVRWRTAQAQGREQAGGDRVSVSVYLSARQAQQSQLPAMLRAALERHQLTPADLRLEISESVLAEAATATLEQLADLRAGGVGITITSFGVQAGLRDLARLPVDAVKIDESLTAGLATDPTNVKIVRAIAGLAGDLGLACGVEGIQTPEQRAALPAGVLGQGDLFGPPAAEPTVPAHPR